MTQRTGIIARKIGMMQLFNQTTSHSTPVSVLSVECMVVGHRTVEKDGYLALQVGTGTFSKRRLTRARKGFFEKNQVPHKRKIVEFRIEQNGLIPMGTPLTASHFVEGQYVDVRGHTIGKGFAGVMKRHNFKGLEASHGVSVSHRSHGSTGQCQDPGRVFKGKKMAGQMGNKQITKQNLQIIKIDSEKGLLCLKGSVPGCKGSWLLIQDALKKSQPDLPVPTAEKIDISPTDPKEPPSLSSSSAKTSNEGG